MINPNHLYSHQRTGQKHQSKPTENRTDFQRDYDRIVFSAAFRRLQNKTQVFPLPGSVFVHNRLTHSLEVASVGRSLGTLVGELFVKKFKAELTENSNYFYEHNLAYVIASACLCHDIGNPAFGHSGEDAIAQYFIKNESILKAYFTEKQWADFTQFEGNANAIRVLTHQQNGKSAGGLMLTHSTLASIAKYPCESVAKNKDMLHRKKFGFFQSEKSTFKDIAKSCGLLIEEKKPLSYYRHPFVWLVEAADDICYNIIDFEDAHRLGIVEHRECVELFTEVIKDLSPNDLNKITHRMSAITDKNDKISYLRAKIIGLLIESVTAKYSIHFDKILSGKFTTPLYDLIFNKSSALKTIKDFSVNNIYNHRNVVEIENAGYNVMYELLNHFIPPVLKEEHSNADKKALKLLPPNFTYPKGDNYAKVLGILDYISEMTDNYAVDLYKKIKGIEIGMM